MNKILFFFFLLSTLSVSAQDQIGEELFASGFEIPVDIVFDDINNMYVVEKRGKIALVTADGIKSTTSFIDIQDRVNSSANERGLLGLALHPNFENNGYFYVNYTGTGYTQISRFTRVNDTLADPNSEVELLTIPQPFNNHNAGALHFGPDGYLYIGLGDGGSSGDPDNRSQNPNMLLGKMLRIDVDGQEPYSVPLDNPYFSSSDTLPEIWAFGLRNPWKFSFDQTSGDMYIADVGQNKWEEIDVQKNGSTGGENYGWRCYEGFEEFKPTGCGPASQYVPPVFVYANNENIDGCSVTGGYVYRGASIPYLSGKYIYGDYCSGKIWALEEDECGNWVNEQVFKINSQELTTFGQDKLGEIYFAKVGEGRIYKINERCNLSSTVETIPATCNLNNGSIMINSNSANFTFSIEGGSLINLAPGTYHLTVSDDQNCINNHCVTIGAQMDTFAYPIITEVEKLTLCEGLEAEVLAVDLLLANFPNVTVDLYLDSMLLENDWNGTYDFVQSGIYQLVFRNTVNNCSSPIQDFLNLKVAVVPPVSITREENSLVATPGFVGYDWFAGLDRIQSGFSNILETFEVNKEYRVIAYTLDGCATTSTKFIITNTIDVNWIKQVSINPIPTSDYLVTDIDFGKVTDCTLSIVSSTGEMVFTKNYSRTTTIKENIDLTNQPSGIYFINISANNKTATQQIIKL